MGIRDLAGAILAVAEKATPFIPGTMDDAAIAGAKAVVNLIDKYHEVSGATDEQLSAKRDELEARVLDGLRSEAEKLRG